MSPKQIICIKWGSMYGPEYVNILYGMVARNISGKFTVICFTDDRQGIRKEVQCFPLPSLECEIPADVPGKWPKVALWNRDLFGLKGTALFVDLDSVIVDNIDDYFEYGKPEDVITARNWVRYFGKHGQTSVFRFPIGGHSYILDNLRADSEIISRRYKFEQNYVTGSIRGGVKFWPEAWTKHFGIHCMGPGPVRLMRPPVKPRGAKIITFPGHPKPPDAIAGRWAEELSPRSPKQHLQWVWDKRKTEPRWRRHLWRYVLPTQWVAEHWRE